MDAFNHIIIYNELIEATNMLIAHSSLVNFIDFILLQDGSSLTAFSYIYTNDFQTNQIT